MDKIRLGKTNMMVTRVGFGGIPIQRVSEDEAVAVVRKCLSVGVRYLDTATGYTTSEERIGKAIRGRQEGVILATKSRPKTGDELRNNLKQSLERLGVASIDLYQFHLIATLKDLDDVIAPSESMVALQETRKAGRVKHIGFSTHNIEVAKAAIKTDQFETCMFPFNYISNEAADELLPVAREHDVGFIAIKSLAGGRIDNIKIAFKYLFQFPDILVLPGIERPHEIEEIVQILEDPQMSPAEQEEMRQLREKLSSRYCRHCDKCMPCPQGVPIPMLMDFEGIIKSITPENIYTGHFGDLIKQGAKCDNCGDCEEKCSYNLPIRELLADYLNQYEEGLKQYQAGLKA